MPLRAKKKNKKIYKYDPDGYTLYLIKLYRQFVYIVDCKKQKKYTFSKPKFKKIIESNDKPRIAFGKTILSGASVFCAENSMWK